jgi:hypothetical protein
VIKWIGLAVLWVFALLGAIWAVDRLTIGGGEGLIGGSPVFAKDESAETLLSGRIVRFPPLLQRGNRRAAVLDDDYYFCSRGSGSVVRVPRGFVTDFASIPDIARILIDRFGPSLEPATVHDWLYTIGAGETDGERQTFRAEADDIFLDALSDNGAGRATGWVMYAAVRLFGSGPYDTSREWTGRLLDPETGLAFEPDIPRPAKIGILDHLDADCATFQEKINHLVGCYSTDQAQLFDASMREQEACGPSDGVIVPRRP